MKEKKKQHKNTAENKKFKNSVNYLSITLLCLFVFCINCTTSTLILL